MFNIFPTHSVDIDLSETDSFTQSRNKFIKFAKDRGYDLSLDEAGYYMNSLTQRMWDVWEDSRRVNK
jgi:hypothetical protein